MSLQVKANVTWPYTYVSPSEQNIQLLDPAPGGTGEWVTVTVPKWDLNWVEIYDWLEGPVDFKFFYTLPDEFDDEQFKCEYKEKRWYLPAAGYPAFNITIYI